jgi:hypothetical protein
LEEGLYSSVKISWDCSVSTAIKLVYGIVIVCQVYWSLKIFESPILKHTFYPANKSIALET